MKTIIFLTTMMILIAGCGSKWDESFVHKDIKDDFCGAKIDYRYCKCAFHGDFCEELGMTKKAADTYVRSEFEAWEYQELMAFKAYCENKGGVFYEKTEECQLCPPGEMFDAEGNCA